MQLCPKLAKIVDIFNPCVELIRHAAESKGLKLVWRVMPNTIAYFYFFHQCSTIMVDERRLKQIILNLLSNSIKFTNEGTISLTARQKIDKGKEIVSIKVSDTGMGIKQEDIPKLFREFSMLETHRVANPNGIIKLISYRNWAWVILISEIN